MTGLTLAQIRPSFDPGAVYVTPLARGALLLAGIEAESLLTRHAGGDYGIATAARAAANDRHIAMCAGLVVSAYIVARQAVIHVMTDLNAGQTWILTADDLVKEHRE